jgi:hypothetical protein
MAYLEHLSEEKQVDLHIKFKQYVDANPNNRTLSNTLRWLESHGIAVNVKPTNAKYKSLKELREYVLGGE